MHSLILGLLACVELAHATDLDIVAGRLRNAAATASLSASYSQGYNVSQVSSWLSSIQPDGSWPDIDYTTGCAASKYFVFHHKLTTRYSNLARGSALGPNYRSESGLVGFEPERRPVLRQLDKRLLGRN